MSWWQSVLLTVALYAAWRGTAHLWNAARIRKAWRDRFPAPDAILFKTTDGVDMRMGDSYWYISRDSYRRWKIYHTKICSMQDCLKGDEQFGSRENAEKFLEAFRSHLP